MDIAKVLAELRQELENIDAAILSLERLQSGVGLKRKPAAAQPRAGTQDRTVPVDPPGKGRKHDPPAKNTPE